MITDILNVISFDDIIEALNAFGRAIGCLSDYANVEKLYKNGKPFKYLPKKNHYVKNTAPVYKIERKPQKNQPYQRRTY